MRSWAVREHSRRLDNDLLGLDPTKTWDEPTKTRLLARWMWDRKTRGGHMVHDMLRWVIWAPLADVPKRLWEATQGKSPWRMDHLGLSALGELVGMARPDDFPPRNNRTSRTVHALGWTVRRYGG